MKKERYEKVYEIIKKTAADSDRSGVKWDKIEIKDFTEQDEIKLLSTRMLAISLPFEETDGFTGTGKIIDWKDDEISWHVREVMNAFKRHLVKELEKLKETFPNKKVRIIATWPPKVYGLPKEIERGYQPGELPKPWAEIHYHMEIVNEEFPEKIKEESL